ETEALVRTVALFGFARDKQLCVHGAMLSEERQWMQFEAGSKYLWRSLYPLRALGQEDDLRERRLAVRDARERRFAYSAWWYTAFPIDITPDNPLPIFVRGDDVAFGLMHTGRHTVTLNGIVVWHADFHLKNNPSSLFYEMRNFATIDRRPPQRQGRGCSRCRRPALAHDRARHRSHARDQARAVPSARRIAVD
ncbi:MAG: hypothetical protein EBU98_05660, partial [Actinobacteria bacterium]|nr:hypothetical protein [Actinomycetota bacterium]